MGYIKVAILMCVMFVGSVLGDPFSQDMLDQHNKYRAEHHVKPLKYDPDIAAFAQEWAEHLLKKGAIEHREETKGYGENLWQGGGAGYEWKHTQAVEDWYKEVKDYDFTKDQPDDFGKVGHFTQVVWDGTEYVGCGIARGETGTIIVCNYSPPGNMQGQYTANVFPRDREAGNEQEKATPEDKEADETSKPEDTPLPEKELEKATPEDKEANETSKPEDTPLPEKELEKPTTPKSKEEEVDITPKPNEKPLPDKEIENTVVVPKPEQKPVVHPIKFIFYNKKLFTGKTAFTKQNTPKGTMTFRIHSIGWPSKF